MSKQRPVLSKVAVVESGTVVIGVVAICELVTYSRTTSSTFLVTSAIAAFSAMVMGEEGEFVGNRGVMEKKRSFVPLLYLSYFSVT